METNKLKWWQMRRVKLTRQYVAGTIAGTGIGAVLTCSLPSEAAFVLGRVLGFVLIAIGSMIAYNDQQKSITTTVN